MHVLPKYSVYFDSMLELWTIDLMFMSQIPTATVIVDLIRFDFLKGSTAALC